MLRVVKRDGYILIVVPSNLSYHGQIIPPDAWRFFNDAAPSLVNWGKRNGYQDVRMVQGFIHGKVEYQGHEDNIMIFTQRKKRAEEEDLQVPTAPYWYWSDALKHLYSNHNCWTSLRIFENDRDLKLQPDGLAYSCCMWGINE